MCGRFTLRTSPASVASLFDGLDVPDFPPNYNVAPTQRVVTVRESKSARQVAFLRWGLIPFWAKDASIGSRLINARSETVHEKPSFRDAFRKRRCLILADGFYEWKKTETGKQPMYIQMRDGRPWAMAGLWESNDHSGERVETCSILTTSANEMMSAIHDRMPVILPEQTWPLWLDSGVSEAERLRPLLVPYEEEDLTAWPVSKAVNKPSFNQPACIEPIA